jgi:hypothetical protein
MVQVMTIYNHSVRPWNDNYIVEGGLKWKVFPFLGVNDGMIRLFSVGVLELRIVAPCLDFPLNLMFFPWK